MNIMLVHKIAAMEITFGSELPNKETTIEMVDIAAKQLIEICRSSKKCELKLIDEKFKTFAQSARDYNNSNSSNKLMLAQRPLRVIPDDLKLLTAGEIIKAMFNVRMPCDYGCALIQRNDEGKADNMSDVKKVILYNNVFNVLGEYRLDIEENIKKLNKDKEKAKPQWKKLFLLKTALGGISLSGSSYFAVENYFSNKLQYYIGLCFGCLTSIYTLWQLYRFNNYAAYAKIQENKIENIEDTIEELKKLESSFTESFKMLETFSRYENKSVKNGFGKRIPKSFLQDDLERKTT